MKTVRSRQSPPHPPWPPTAAEFLRQLEKEHTADMLRPKYRRLFSEAEKALERVGTTTDGKMRWLLRFSQCDLATLTSAEKLNLAYDLLFLREAQSTNLYDVSKTDRLEVPNLDADENWQFILNRLTPGFIAHSMEKGVDVLPSIQSIRKMQKLLREKLKGLNEGGRAHFSARTLTLRTGVIGGFRHGYFHVVAETPFDQFVVSIANLIRLCAGRIRICPGCHSLFLAERRNQSFCSVTCQSRTNMRRYRGTPPERFGRRGRPKKEVPRLLKAGKARKRRRR